MLAGVKVIEHFCRIGVVNWRNGRAISPTSDFHAVWRRRIVYSLGSLRKEIIVKERSRIRVEMRRL